MNALILCAGMGSRFNISNDLGPKCLIKFNHRKLIDIQIESLKKSNINNIAAVSGYKSQLVKNKKINKIYFNKNWENTNMIYSMFCASEWIEKGDCLISYGDIFYNQFTIKNLINSKDDINILYHTDFMKMWMGRYENPYEDLESFKFNSSGYLLDIGQSVSEKDNIMGQFMGLIYIKKNGWAIFKNLLNTIDIKTIDFTSALQFLVKKDVKVKCIATNDIWGEIDTVKDLNFYESYYEN
tara:strand:- start:1 stop:720 length:720 start_codon:yes stop_codon:yes gene_type:complete